MYPLGFIDTQFRNPVLAHLNFCFASTDNKQIKQTIELDQSVEEVYQEDNAEVNFVFFM